MIRSVLSVYSSRAPVQQIKAPISIHACGAATRMAVSDSVTCVRQIDGASVFMRGGDTSSRVGVQHRDREVCSR